MWNQQPIYHHHTYPPPPHPNVRNNANAPHVSFRQDSTVCKACTQHLFRTEAIRCHGTCKGEFHAECSRYDWTCGKCKKENSIVREDFDIIKSAVDNLNKNLIKTDEKITELRVETVAGKLSDNVEISELRTELREMHYRFNDMEKQIESATAAMTELKTTVSGLDRKITIFTASQKQFDQIDISGIQDTLRNSSQIILAEMTETLDRLIEEKTLLEKRNQRQTSESNSKELPAEVLEENTQMFHTYELPQSKLHQLLRQQISKIDNSKKYDEEETLMKEHSQQHQKISRLQQLAAQFQLQ